MGGWVVIVALVTAGLHQIGTGPLAPPPLSQPGDWPAWLAARDPVAAAMALIRLLALGAASYLLAVSVLGGGLRLVRARRLVRIADRVTPAAVRRLLVATAGVTLASGLVPSAVFARGPQPPAVVTSVAHPLVTTAAPPTGPTVTMHLLPAEPEPVAMPVAEPVAAPVAAAPAPRVTAAATWTVRPGECFWSIAEDVLVRALGRPVTDSEIVPYWRALIEENRHLLGDRDNADLIFAGQVFAVPSPPPRAA
ncbi:MAG: LysM peptidoglycan-binding domain-containing protein [Acidimicrobiales bacterium]